MMNWDVLHHRFTKRFTQDGHLGSTILSFGELIGSLGEN